MLLQWNLLGVDTGLILKSKKIRKKWPIRPFFEAIA